MRPPFLSWEKIIDLRWSVLQTEDMSTVDDLRKVLQDFLAPELRTITAQLDSMEKITSAKFEAIETKMDARFDSLSSQVQEIKNLMEIEKRLTRLEGKQPVSQ
jgi:DNA anti-recombination protein RmuC